MNAEAIRKLRLNFISISMFSFILVMLFTGGLINLANDQKIRSDMRAMLDYIISQEGNLYNEETSSSATSTRSAATKPSRLPERSWSGAPPSENTGIPIITKRASCPMTGPLSL